MIAVVLWTLAILAVSALVGLVVGKCIDTGDDGQ